MDADQIVVALARLGERIDGVTAAVGVMRADLHDDMRVLREDFRQHLVDADRRFNAAAVITDTKVADVYRFIAEERRSFNQRALQFGAIIVTLLGAFTGIVLHVISKLPGKS